MEIVANSETSSSTGLAKGESESNWQQDSILMISPFNKLMSWDNYDEQANFHIYYYRVEIVFALPNNNDN